MKPDLRIVKEETRETHVGKGRKEIGCLGWRMNLFSETGKHLSVCLCLERASAEHDW